MGSALLTRCALRIDSFTSVGAKRAERTGEKGYFSENAKRFHVNRSRSYSVSNLHAANDSPEEPITFISKTLDFLAKSLDFCSWALWGWRSWFGCRRFVAP